MDIGIAIIALIIGYLSGSLSFSRILTKLFAPEVDLDKLTIPMENGEDEKIPGVYGANAASMVKGTKLGLTVAVLDILKAVIPMLIIKLLFKGEPCYLFSGFGGLLGHNWPIYHGFKGGRGFAVIVGSFFVID
ncbi:glycerol-3-phosphate acyltransferase, partial [Candidatus Thorarchaeota archaeon]